MKLRYSIILMATLSAAVSCVQMTEDDLGGGQEQEKLPLSVTATIETGSQTKTALEGSLSDASMRTVWMPSDNIGVVAVLPTMGENVAVEEFVTGISEKSNVASFEGSVTFASEYYAFYPYSESLRNSNGTYIFTILQEQKYVAGSFDPKAAPMVAKAPREGDFDFQNLCGLLALQLTGSESVKSITFIGKDAAGTMMPVSGTFSVDMTYTDEPVIMVSEPMTSVTLISDTPVQLSQQATPFYFVLPPATYNSFIIMIQTSDGNVMVKEATKPLTIARSHIKPTAALQYAENVYIDLSEEGWSNSYVVSNAGAYTFDASVIGNGKYGLSQEGDFHTDNTNISPKSVELLWEEHKGMLTGLRLVDGKVKFLATGQEGNALIAVKDSDGTILWSWHIWCTDKPKDQTYVNSAGTFIVQDRNLGATRGDRGVNDEWMESCGIDYLWGRKDPFAAYKHTQADLTQMSETIKNPTVKSTSWDWNVLSSSWWSESHKTIYDPCPVGYRVASQAIWNDFSISKVSGDFDHGRYYQCNETDYAWYPTRANHQPDRVDYWGDTYMMSSNFRGGIYSSSGSFRTQSVGYGPLRCMKETYGAKYDVSMTGIDDVTSSSVTVSANVYVEGTKAVSRRGFIYGVNAELSIDNAPVVESGNGPGDFSASISNLSGSTKYYIRAFAVIDTEVIYSNIRSFMTPGASGVIDLSAKGTANSYMVSQAGTYKFKATVKGNSTEAINPNAAEVIWETQNISDAVTQGSVISSVVLEDGYVKFSTPTDFTPGNALIAVKSAGKIVWSWHIWAVESDPEVDAQLYQSGALMMDRNLGALSVTPGDERSYGLFYQWGRKDPFMGCGNAVDNSFATTYPEDAMQFLDNNANYNNYNYVEVHPNHFVKRSSWNNDSKYWTTNKTMYDPCPVGWRVPDADSDVWSGFNTISSVDRGAFFNAPVSDPTAYYPFAGYLNANAQLGEVNSVLSVWTTTLRTTFRIAQSNAQLSSSDIYNAHQIRCMKDADFTIATGNIEEIFISDVYIKVPGKLVVLDDTAMESKGVVCSSTTSTPRLRQEGSISVAADKSSPEIFNVTVTGLKPNTKYWVRTYAKGGHNIRYGETREIWTKASADNEGYGSEDFEW